MNNFYAPDQANDWQDLGPATRKLWPNGIPSLIITEEGEFYYKEYAGNVWRLKIKNENPELLKE